MNNSLPGFDADMNHFTMPQPASASNATAFPNAGAESNLNMESLDLEQSWMFPSTNVDWVSKRMEEEDSPFLSHSKTCPLSGRVVKRQS